MWLCCVRSFRSPPPPPRLTLAAVAPLQNSTTPFRLLLKTRFISSIKEKRQPLYHPTSMSHSSDDERPIGPVNSNCATSGTVEEPIELRRLPPDSNADTTYLSEDEASFRPVVNKRVTIVVDEAETCSLLPNPDADGMFHILRFLFDYICRPSCNFPPDDGWSIDNVGAPTTQIATYPQTRMPLKPSYFPQHSPLYCFGYAELFLLTSFTGSKTILNNRGTSAYNRCDPFIMLRFFMISSFSDFVVRHDDAPSPAKLTALEQLTSNW